LNVTFPSLASPMPTLGFESLRKIFKVWPAGDCKINGIKLYADPEGKQPLSSPMLTRLPNYELEVNNALPDQVKGYVGVITNG
jgi:hypothetical protein